MSIKMDAHYKHLRNTLDLLVAQYGKYQVQDVLNQVDESAVRRQVAEIADERKQTIAKLHESGLTLEEIGCLFGISRERVRQLILIYETEVRVYQDEIERQKEQRTTRLARRRRAYEQRAQGKTYREIGEELGVTWQGAKHLCQTYQKTLDKREA